MKNIVRVSIKNFQSHEDTDISFGDFVAIIGTSDLGKTAIIRAICWNLYNVPSGTSFIRTGADFAEVTVYFSDGTVIKRYRGEENYYEVDVPGKEKLRLEHFGSGAVDIVMEAHGMYLVDLSGKEESLNINGQMQPQFFILDGPSGRAKIISKLSGVDIVDTALSNVNSQLRTERKRLAELTSSAKELEGNLREFDDFEEHQKDVKLVGDAVNRISSLKQKAESLQGTFLKIQTLIGQSESAARRLTFKPHLERLLRLVSQVQVLNGRSDVLQSSYSKIVQLISDNNKNQTILSNKDDLSKLSSYIDKVCGLRNKTDSLQELFVKINKRTGEKGDMCRTIEALNKEKSVLLANAQREMEDSEFCPTCGSEILKSSVICDT